MTAERTSANGISSVLGRRLTITLGMVVGLLLIAFAIMVFLVTIMSVGGGSFIWPVSVFGAVMIAVGFGLMLRTAWWADRSR